MYHGECITAVYDWLLGAASSLRRFVVMLGGLFRIGDTAVNRFVRGDPVPRTFTSLFVDSKNEP